MNNNIVNNETDLLCYRMRTARQRKRARLKDFEKRLRALDRERKDLWQKKCNLGWIELKPPVMRGWKRYFVLREDVARSKYADFFQGVLDKINTVDYSNRKDFRARKKRLRKWKYETKKQKLIEPGVWEFNKMNFSEKEKQFFEEKLILNYRRVWVKIYVFTEPWRFVLKVRPNMVCRTRIRSEEMETELAYIYRYIESRHLEPKLYRLKGSSYRSYHDWQRHAESKDDKKFRNTPLPKILDEIKAESV
jgi:hypothetical protein